MAGPLSFQIEHQAADCGARVGRVTTPHGSFDTPAFMPVGTQATVKGMWPAMTADIGAQIILANTYHLMLRPSSELVAKMGGLHKWMRWPRPILTDSGGFQVFSLNKINQINDDGVTFKSHLDGSTVELTPARSMQVQNELGADIIMAFDDCPPVAGSGDGVSGIGESDDDTQYPIPDTRIRQACERSLRWLSQCVKSHQRSDDQALFGIVQGGTDLELRSWCAQRICEHDLPGYAIGGVAVGETFNEIRAVVEHTAPLLPADKPRYLMGVGYEKDILAAVRSGVDMFDCVLPTRNARNGNAFTPTGQIRVRNASFAEDSGVIDPNCDCPACEGGFSRSYIRHLLLAKEMLGPILITAHNLRHFQRYLLDIRHSIADNDWSLFMGHWPVAAP